MVLAQAHFDPLFYSRLATSSIIPPIVGMSSTVRKSENGIFTEATSDDQEGSRLSISSASSGVLIKYGFPARVLELLPEQGDLFRDTGSWLDSERGLPVHQMLHIAAYLSSNNLLSVEQAKKFLLSMIERSYVGVLKSFLRLETPTTQVFGLRLVEAAILLKDINLLRQMQSAGATFNHVAELVMEVGNAEVLDLVVSALDPSLLKGVSGGRLLRLIARTSHVKVAEKLIQAGAEVNIDEETTPLWEAVHRNKCEMIKLLARAGADMNRCNSYNDRPLGHAVLYGNVSTMKCLIDHGAKVAGVEVAGRPLLAWSSTEAPAIYKILVKCEPHLRAKFGVPEILSAAEAGQRRLADCIFRHQQDVEDIEFQLEIALVQALRTNATKAVANLLEYGVNPDGPLLCQKGSDTYFGESPLFEALDSPASKERYIHASLLLQYKADVNAENWLTTFLISGYDARLFRLIVEAGFDLDRYGAEGLEYAIEKDKLEAVPLLLELGAPVNQFGNRATPLQVAAYTGNIALVKLLIDRGAVVDEPAYSLRGFTVMQGAAMSGTVDMVKFVRGLGATLNAKPAAIEGVTTLEAAARSWSAWDKHKTRGYHSGHNDVREKVLTYLLDEGAEVNRDDGAPSRLLHDLIELEETALLRRVVQAGAQLEHKWGTESTMYFLRTPLQLAAELDKFDAVDILLEHGAQINASAATKRGRIALQAAASSEHANLKMMELLLSRGAEVNAPAAGDGGVTALQAAVIRGHFNMALMLIEQKADVNAPPALKNGRTAIDGAAERGRFDIVQMLLNAGAVGDPFGKYGFENAIKLAKKFRHKHVVDLLEEWVLNQEFRAE